MGLNEVTKKDWKTGHRGLIKGYASSSKGSDKSVVFLKVCFCSVSHRPAYRAERGNSEMSKTFKPNKYINRGDYTKIELIKRGGIILEAKIDTEDVPECKRYHWYESHGYVRATTYTDGKHATIYLHNLILNRRGSLTGEADHIDRDGLNNRRLNLRPCTTSQNQMNTLKCRTNGDRKALTSFYKGVHRNYKKWYAQINIDKKQTSLGSFKTEIEAARAYDMAALRYHDRDFIKLNFPGDKREYLRTVEDFI